VKGGSRGLVQDSVTSRNIATNKGYRELRDKHVYAATSKQATIRGTVGNDVFYAVLAEATYQGRTAKFSRESI
jgi:hypothetical protein